MKMTETKQPIFYENRKFLPNEFAKYLIDESGEHFVTPRDTEIIHRYSDGIYKPDGATYVKEMVEMAVDGKNITAKTASEVMGHIQRRTYIARDEFDSDDNEITVQNGVLNTKTFEFTRHDEKKYSLLKVPVEYDPNADCPEFKKFLNEILPDSVERDTIIELFGYCLIKNHSIQQWFLFHGKGSNGKGTLLSTLRVFLGEENVSAVELQNFEKQFSVAELYGKLANIVGDLSDKELYHSGRLKSLTGGDLLMAERKFQNPFHFVNHAKLIYSANDLPKTFDGTFAFWRRVMLVKFMQTFTGDKDSKDLWKKFTTKAELSGIMNMAIEGIKRLDANQRFTKQDSVDEIKDYYIRDSDPMAAFFMDCVEITNDANDFVSLQTFHTAFVEYCKRWKFKDTSMRKFNALVRKDFNIRESREFNEATNKQDRVWTGVYLSYDKDTTTLPILVTECTEMTVLTKHENTKKGEYRPRESGQPGQYSLGNNIIEYIQKKVSEYGNESDHSYNVIEAMLEKDGHPINEIEYCIKLYKQGHRVYIPRKED